jgi:hypothetical protein
MLIYKMLILMALFLGTLTSSYIVLGQTPNSIRMLSWSDHVDAIDYLHVVGEVENGSPSVIRYLEVVGTFYDSANQVVATASAFTNPQDLKPGNKAPFEILVLSASIPVRQINNYTLALTYQ